MNTRKYNEILKSLKKACIAKIRDYSDYKDGQCSTGGCYVYTQRYSKIGKNMWKLSFHTSSIFSYCECCGNFYSGDYCSCYGEYTELTTQEVSEIIATCWEDPEIVIEIK